CSSWKWNPVSMPGGSTIALTPKAVTPSPWRTLRKPGPSPSSSRCATAQPSPRRTCSNSSISVPSLSARGRSSMNAELPRDLVAVDLGILEQSARPRCERGQLRAVAAHRRELRRGGRIVQTHDARRAKRSELGHAREERAPEGIDVAEWIIAAPVDPAGPAMGDAVGQLRVQSDREACAREHTGVAAREHVVGMAADPGGRQDAREALAGEPRRQLAVQLLRTGPASLPGVLRVQQGQVERLAPGEGERARVLGEA